jgi:hypothetical protein
MDMEPKTEREHIISLQGHITGVKREIEVIKTNHEAVHKGTSIGRNPITSTMNKKKKASFKKYRGQGKRR